VRVGVAFPGKSPIPRSNLERRIGEERLHRRDDGRVLAVDLRAPAEPLRLPDGLFRATGARLLAASRRAARTAWCWVAGLDAPFLTMTM
jgi:hypothetical protein